MIKTISTIARIVSSILLRARKVDSDLSKRSNGNRQFGWPPSLQFTHILYTNYLLLRPLFAYMYIYKFFVYNNVRADNLEFVHITII